MRVFFDSGKLAFYPESIYPVAPEYAIELTEEEIKEYCNNSAPEGKLLAADSSGRPCWSDQQQRHSCWKAERISAYRSESDPIRMEIEADAILNGKPPDYSPWISKINEIKSRFPKP